MIGKEFTPAGSLRPAARKMLDAVYGSPIHVRLVRSKYGNKKTQIDGITFDSKREATRYVDLKHMQQLGLIEDLRLQVPFVLAPAVMVKGRNRPPLRYIADFVYLDKRSGRQVVEDAKGRVTEGYRIKRHLMASVLGIQVVEV